MQQGEIIECITAGGGGYGDPLARPPREVAEDVRDGFVSRESAAGDYGVVLTAAAEVDNAATERLRAGRRAARGEINWTFDRGELGRS
jgi:N-methylhydantoinase B